MAVCNQKKSKEMKQHLNPKMLKYIYKNKEKLDNAFQHNL